MDSILQYKKQCYVCGTVYGLHCHHIYGGANRKNSEANGFKVWLCGKHHNLSNAGVHFNRQLDLQLKELCQRQFEETHSREEFMRIIGKNYIGVVPSDGTTIEF